MNYKKMLVEAGKQMLQSGLTVETWGNISLRDPDTDLIYLTPSGMPYDDIEEEDVVVMDLNGNRVEGERKPTVETPMHLLIYQNRSDVNAIIHTHPVHSLVFGVLHQSIPAIIDEAAQTLGDEVRCTNYALPGSKEIAEEALNALGENYACILANHGALLVGRDLDYAFKAAKVLEMTAEIYHYALSTGGKITRISEEDGEYMRDFMNNHYGQDKE